MAVGTTTLSSRSAVILDSTVFTGDFNQAKINFSQNELDVSTFGTVSWKKKIVGISDGSIDLTGFGQKSGHTLDAKLYSMLGAPADATAMEIDVPTSNVGDLRYTFQVYLKNYSMDLKVADAFKLTASFSINGAPTRSVISS